MKTDQAKPTASLPEPFAELNRRYELHKATHSGEWDEAKHQETFQFFAEAVFNCWPKIVAALSAQSPAQAEWQPIETARTNRKLIVGYWNPLGNWRTILATYHTEGTLESETDESGFAPEGWYEATEAYEYLMPVEHEPVLWRELPPQPPMEEERIKEALDQAKETVQPIIDAEKKGEDVGDVMSMQLRSAPEPQQSPRVCVKCGHQAAGPHYTSNCALAIIGDCLCKCVFPESEKE